MVAGLPSAAVADVLTLLAEFMPECPHLEFILKWLRLLCLKHGPALQVSHLLPLQCFAISHVLAGMTFSL